MSKTLSRLKSKPDVKINKANADRIPDDDDDDQDLNEYMLYSAEDERVSKKMAARRKIDIHMEKKRLREELIYFDEEDFDF